MNNEPEPLVENSADAQQIRKARKSARVTDQRKLDYVKELLDTAAGRWLFREIIADGGLFVATRSTTDELHFNEGKRNLAIKYLALVEKARPDLISILKAS